MSDDVRLYDRFTIEELTDAMREIMIDPESFSGHQYTEEARRRIHAIHRAMIYHYAEEERGEG